MNPKYSELDTNTKRKILAQTAALFDPLSLFLPVTIKGRLILRDLWKLKLGWDDVITDNLYARWEELYQDFMLLGNLEFPRILLTSTSFATPPKLHIGL